LLERADFITLHVPKNDKTAKLINKDSIAKMKKGVRIINCARGGIVVEADLKAALDSGHVAGAALDVFEEEPAKANVLFNHPNVVCTPHLGASTTEAQVNVAIQVAEQMSDFLLNGAVANAINMPSISAEDAPKLKPYLTLAAQLGNFAGQIAEQAITKVEIEYRGAVTELNVKPLTSMVLASLLKPLLANVNMVNAGQVAKARGITVSETKTAESGDPAGLIRVIVTAEGKARDVAGTLSANREPRIVTVEGVPVEAALSPHMLYFRNKDQPGFIGGVGTILGGAGLNIGDFRLGRSSEEGVAVSLISLDSAVPDEVLKKLATLPQVQQMRSLKF
jgi:D-3-phosphoglycerate dehydrogenase / 2-oxoglutarate reductase